MTTYDRTEYADVAIIGGGASGFAAAVELKLRAPWLSVVILEKNSEPAKKIRATGSGRCNITNTSAEGYGEITAFFGRIGLAVRVYDNGLVYPYSESAADVADLLIERAGQLGVRIVTDAEVTELSAKECDFGITFRHTRGRASGRGRVTSGSVRAGCVILACGGKAGPMFGTTGDGYRLARAAGHTIVTPVPVLTQIECAEWADTHRPCAVSLAGTRTRGCVALHRHKEGSFTPGEEIFRETGEIQFTSTGLSGICVFNMTRHMRYDRSRGESLSDYVVTADLYPDGDIGEFLTGRRAGALPEEKTEHILRTVLRDNIAQFVLRSAASLDSHAAERPVRELTDSNIQAIAGSVHCLAFHPQRLRGWREAQATAGGVSLEELDPGTSESLIVPGLFITGELADRDFPCGGFNLSNAWLTGIHAAECIAGRNTR